MSCFWDALIKKINYHDHKYYFKLNKINPYNFAVVLKKKNKSVNTVIVNNIKINLNQQKENFEHIKNYDLNTINDGYLCSTFDPFLILISDLLSITINNTFNNSLIIYKPIGYTRYTINIENDLGHMK